MLTADSAFVARRHDEDVQRIKPESTQDVSGGEYGSSPLSNHSNMILRRHVPLMAVANVTTSDMTGVRQALAFCNMMQSRLARFRSSFASKSTFINENQRVLVVV
jgi:hypothetical protein